MANWANIYNFDSPDSLSIRVRRLERGEQYLRAGDLVAPSGAYAGVPTSLLDGNKIDLTSSDLKTQGSIPPAGVVGNFGFTATTTSISMFWDGTNGSAKLKLIRADGTAIQIPTGSMTVSGLTSNTLYGFLPFWSPFNNCAIGFIKGDSGTDPQKFAFSPSAQTVQNSTKQLLQGREALTSGFITFPTPASGSTSGGGSRGGYGGGCVMLGTNIKPMGENNEYSTWHHRQTDWLHLSLDDERSLSCTPDHPLYHPEHGKRRADLFTSGDWIVTDHGERKVSDVRMFYKDCTKMEVKMPSGHLYFANGFLSHNVKLY